MAVNQNNKVSFPGLTLILYLLFLLFLLFSSSPLLLFLLFPSSSSSRLPIFSFFLPLLVFSASLLDSPLISPAQTPVQTLAS